MIFPHIVVQFFAKVHHLLTFEKRLIRRNKIILAALVFCMWLATPMSMKMMVISRHCINLGLGLLIHGLIFYRKPKLIPKPICGVNLNLNRRMTVALGLALFVGGVVSRRAIL